MRLRPAAPSPSRRTSRPAFAVWLVAASVLAGSPALAQSGAEDAGTGSAAATETPAEVLPDFIRFVENDQGAYLQTGIGHYVSPEGAKVDLIGAVHIADKSYFEALNARFKTYDALLYELVGRPVTERTEIKAGDDSSRLRWLGRVQESMRKALALESQLHVIDYTAANLVHADLSLERFFESQEEKKETFFSLWWKAVQAQANSASKDTRKRPGLGKILELLMRKDSATELKRLIGREFDAVEEMVAGMETDGGTTIIGERNRHALEVLEREIKGGKRRLGIFYGAAHLPDMEARLLKMGYKREGVEWLSAWTLPPEPQPAATKP